MQMNASWGKEKAKHRGSTAQVPCENPTKWKVKNRTPVRNNKYPDCVSNFPDQSTLRLDRLAHVLVHVRNGKETKAPDA